MTRDEKLQRAHRHAEVARRVQRMTERNSDTERDRQLALIEVGLAQVELLQLIEINTKKPSL